jgi:hypothetical protein
MPKLTMPRPKERRSWRILLVGVVLLSVSLLSLLCHELLRARGRSPEEALHQPQRTYRLHAGLMTAAAGFLVLGGTSLAYGALRAHRRDG